MKELQLKWFAFIALLCYWILSSKCSYSFSFNKTLLVVQHLSQTFFVITFHFTCMSLGCLLCRARSPPARLPPH